MRPEVDRMRRLLVVCAERSGLCLAGDVEFDRSRSAFRIGKSQVEVFFSPKGDQGWSARNIYEVPDMRNGGMSVKSSVFETAPFGMEASIAKAAVLKAIELTLDSVVDSLGDI